MRYRCPGSAPPAHRQQREETSGMYIPKAFRQDDAATLVEFMRANSFATLVSIQNGAPVASHIPLVVAVRDDVVTLTGHLAKANPHWRALETGESLAIFNGPHAYISPSLYEKRESVPTWNYIAVHAYGTARVLTSDEHPAEVEDMIGAMIGTYEERFREQWDSLPDRFRHGMLAGIVAFELRVTRLEGKYKLSQNRSLTDQASVAHALSHSSDPAARGVADAMLATRAGDGPDAGG
jgi:transcriptional regulator